MFSTTERPDDVRQWMYPQPEAKLVSHHFLPNNLKVEPPTGLAWRGPAISQTVKVT
jgi:hypothetical protein